MKEDKKHKCGDSPATWKTVSLGNGIFKVGWQCHACWKLNECKMEGGICCPLAPHPRVESL